MTPLPKELYSARDAVIGSVYSGLQSHEDLDQIQNWLAFEGWDNLENDDLAINLSMFREFALNDEEFAGNYLGDDEKITDKMRINHAREVIKERLEGDDGDFFPSFASYKMEREDGKSAVVGCMISIVPGGPEPDWCGAFKTHEEFVASLIASDIIPLQDIDEISDLEMLSYWDPKDIESS